jgi:hypothetical protein
VDEPAGFEICDQVHSCSDDATPQHGTGRSVTVGAVPDLAELTRMFHESGNDQEVRSPFNAHLNRRIAEAPAIAALLQSAPDEQQLPVLLLAAVHYIVLSEPDLELAQWYPTASDHPLLTDPFPAFEQLCAEREDQIRSIVARRFTQTNEVGRCAMLLPALGIVAAEQGPLSLVDVGTSAGLNLQLDQYSYRYSPGGTVGGRSPVVLECGTRGAVPVPGTLPIITGRIGIDQHPVDLAQPDEARWLMACVWPDQADRFERIRGAIILAQHRQADIRTADAIDGSRSAVADAAASGHPVVINSWVLNYLTEDQRVAYLAELDAIGAERDLSWVYAESPALCPGIPFPFELEHVHLTALMLVRWRNGIRTVDHLGVAHPHGYWLHWAEPTS